MRRLTTACAVAAMLAAGAGAAWAQTKTITGEVKTTKATIEAIEAASRTLTLKREDGTYVTTVVPDGEKRFDTLKVGDKINARYYENVVLRLKPAGEASVDSASKAMTPGADAAVASTNAKQRTITATVAAIDHAVPSITFTGPNGWKYSSKVEDKKALEKVKVGDKVDITWTEALIVSLDQ
jgi:hypothetical protein